MPSTKHKFYPLEQSCFYRVRSRKRLGKLLFSSVRALEFLANNDDLYSCWHEEKKRGGLRLIEAPHENLKRVQRRLAALLQRIEPPKFLMAPVKGRSYVHNAAAHVGSRAYRLLDLEDFFPSCSSNRVYWFFHKKLKCSPDVASILTKISTRNGYLPQGSPSSPILAYFAYCDMWSEIDEIIDSSGCRLTVYADDITVSGNIIRENDIWLVKKTLHRFGHMFSAGKEKKLIDRPADVTGVIVTQETLLLPNRQHQKISYAVRALRTCGQSNSKEQLKRQLRGRLAQANQVLGHQIG